MPGIGGKGALDPGRAVGDFLGAVLSNTPLPQKVLLRRGSGVAVRRVTDFV